MENGNYDKRVHWKVGSLCLIHSRSKNEWFEGTITRIEGKEMDEWLIVKYGKNNKKSKRIQRNCADIKPIPMDHASLFVEGSICSILSPQYSTWCNGEIIEIFTDEQGEWLKVKYSENGIDVVCDIQRYSKDIKLITQKQKIKNIENNELDQQNEQKLPDATTDWSTANWNEYFEEINSTQSNKLIEQTEQKVDDIIDMDWNEYFDENGNIQSNKDESYNFSKKNHFIDDNKKSIQIIDKLKHSLHDISYYQCIQYLICGYFSMNHQNQAKDVENLCVDYIGFYPFLYEIGHDLMSKQGDMTNAILCFEAYLKDENDSNTNNRSTAFRYLGRCHADNEDDGNAINAYLECYRLNEHDLDVLIALGLAYTNENNQDEALRYFEKFILKHPNYAKLSELEKGKKSKHEYVSFLFNKALEINQNDVDLHIVLGILYFISSEYEVAVKHLKKATQLKSDDASLWNKLGAVLANGGRSKEAISAYLKALELRPNYTRVSVNLGISYGYIGKHNEACKAYLSGLKLNPNASQAWQYLRMSLMHNHMHLIQLCDKQDIELFRPHFEF